MSRPYRLGTTSYILPAGLLDNARYLAGKVQDMELVLFDVDGGPNNYPDDESISAMAVVARHRGLSYTVHLPADLLWDSPAMDKARKAIECTRGLEPWAYVVHLDGRAVRGEVSPQVRHGWQEGALLALKAVSAWVGDPQRVALENLEGYPLDFLAPIYELAGVSRCVDIGHLWLDGHDPLPYLQAALPATRVIHLHGLAEGRDHQSLAHLPAGQLQAVLAWIQQAGFQGVLTLEVFGEEDFRSSLAALGRL